MGGKKKNKAAGGKTLNADQLKDQGNKEFMAGKFDEAIGLYTQAIEMSGDKSNVVYFANRANAYLEKGMDQNCIDDCKKALEIDATFVKAYYRMAKAYFNIQQSKDAQDYLLKALEFEPDNQLVKDLLVCVEDEVKQEQQLPVDNPHYKKLKDFEKWLVINNTKYEKLKIVYYSDENRTVHANTDIAKGETFLEVPQSILITDAVVQTNEICKKVGNNAEIKNSFPLIGQQMMYTQILYQLVKEDDNNKIRQPYFDIFPTEYNEYPYFFGEKELKIIEGSQLLKRIEIQRGEVKDMYELLLKHYPELSKYSLDEYSKAYLTVKTRCFMPDGLPIMIPMADMINHKTIDFNSESRWHSGLKQNKFVALRNIKRGEEISHFYGRENLEYRTKLYFFIVYGFIDLEAPMIITTEINLTEQDPHYELKMELTDGQFNKPHGISIQNDYLGYTVCLIDRTRFILFDGDHSVLVAEKAIYQKNGEPFNPSNFLTPMGLQFEQRVWNKIQSYCQTKLDLYQSTIESDLETLKNKDLEQSVRNCIQIVYEEKLIYEYLINLSNKIHDLIQQNSLKEFKKAVNIDQTLGNWNEYGYLRQCIYPYLNN